MPHLTGLLKAAVLRGAKLTGCYALAARSRWRQQRLLILAYHGISQSDEHLWNPKLYMSAALFRQRMEMLKRSACHVLPLREALVRLYERSLPKQSVALTFDDGAADFHRRAYPILQEYGFPVTVYLTTYYSQYDRPVFPGVCSYLLWQAKHSRLHLKSITGEDIVVELATEAARADVVRRLVRYSRLRRLSAVEKDELARRVADHLNINYERIIRERILHIMNPKEVAEMASRGVDFQLHTHRHRTPLERHLFIKELEDNREAIRRMTGQSANHFCYPDGEFTPQVIGWLKEAGIESATTCYPHLASTTSDVLALPRLIDTSNISAATFEGWICGVASLLTRRRDTIRSRTSRIPDDDQKIEGAVA